MKLVTYTDPTSPTARFIVKIRGERHRFESGKTVEVSDEVASAIDRAAPEGSVTVKAAPSGSNSSTTED